MREKKRLTIVLDRALDQGLEVFCAASGKTKNQVMATALAAYLRSNEEVLRQTLTRALSAAAAG